MDARAPDPTSKEAIGARLKALRLALGNTQGEMARLAGYAAANGWNQVENGINKIPTKHAQELCKHTRVDLNWIFQGVEGGVGRDLALKIRQIIEDLDKAKDGS
jgi:transcriptional regulator with XRE-family HTH domain